MKGSRSSIMTIKTYGTNRFVKTCLSPYCCNGLGVLYNLIIWLFSNTDLFNISSRHCVRDILYLGEFHLILIDHDDLVFKPICCCMMKYYINFKFIMIFIMLRYRICDNVDVIFKSWQPSHICFC